MYLVKLENVSVHEKALSRDLFYSGPDISIYLREKRREKFRYFEDFGKSKVKHYTKLPQNWEK